MITEDYVSFETAKLLKEKGFDGSCYKVWESHGELPTLVDASWFVEGETVVNRESVNAVVKQYAYEYNLNNNVEGYLAPTLQMVMRWLREVHKLGIFPSTYMSLKGDDIKHVYGTSIVNMNTFEVIGNSDKDDYIFESDSYEGTVKKAIKYCLENLI